jgi:ABC-2 type transport system permease protein
MHPGVAIAAKDLRQRLRDRSAVMLAVVVPLALAAIFGVLFGPASTPRPFDYAVVDQDHSSMSGSFVRDVLGALEERGIAKLTVVQDDDAARAGVRAGDLDAAFLLPTGFASSVASERPVQLGIVGSVDAPTATDVARSIGRSYVDGLNAARVAVSAVLQARPRVTRADLQRVAAQTVHSSAPVALVDTSATSRVLDVKTYLAAGMAVFFLLFTVQFGVSSIIDERAEGTLARLLAAPVDRRSILVGKLLTSVALGIISLTVLMVGSTLLLGASWGSPPAVGLLLVSAVLAATGITSVVASLATTREQAGSWQAVVAVCLGLLGGSFFPIQQSGPLMATVSLVTPHAWFMRGLGDLAGGGGVAQVLPAVTALLLMAVLTGAVALRRIGRVLAP